MAAHRRWRTVSRSAATLRTAVEFAMYFIAEEDGDALDIPPDIMDARNCRC
jgi:hypothetical protein